jgi:uncharacterized membrane protein YgdD (TMEM256/DUF423 family)
MQWRGLALIAALSGLAVVVLAAVGTHVLAAMAEAEQVLWNTALLMHLFHTAALLGVAAIAQRHTAATLSWGGLLLALGTLLFSGSLYLKAAGYPLFPGPVTPLGGWILMGGWILLVLTLIKKVAD